MNEMEYRYCEDCKWARPVSRWFRPPDFEYAKCACPWVNPENLISRGHVSTYCSSQRSLGKCGPDGNYWVPKK